ncbi:MAG: hypothetical protein ACYCOO_02155 [Chitinophagaceae bacterium]
MLHTYLLDFYRTGDKIGHDLTILGWILLIAMVIFVMAKYLGTTKKENQDI